MLNKERKGQLNFLQLLLTLFIDYSDHTPYIIVYCYIYINIRKYYLILCQWEFTKDMILLCIVHIWTWYVLANAK